MTRALRLRTSLAQLLTVSALTACGETGPSEQLPPAAVTNVTGAPLAGPAGAALAERVVIRVQDADGNPLPGVAVTFSVTATGASVDPANAITDDRGEARTRWTLGRTPGQQTLTVTAAGSTSIQITATAGPPQIASLSVNAGNNQTGTAGSNLPTAPSVIARDASNNPVEGVTVFFSVMSGGGTVTNASAVTNAQGVASAGTWRLGPNTGTHLLSAQVPQIGVTNNPIVFTATASAGAPVSVTALSATTQTTPIGALVTIVPSVVVRDAAGNPVSGVTVTFALTSGGGEITGGTQTTNGQGVATIGSWRVGPTSGTNTVNATVSGLTPVTFTAIATAGAPVLIEKTLGDNQTSQVNRPVPIAPQVRVVDAAGNGVGGVTVTFTVASGDGAVIIGTVVTGVDGKATVGAWILGPTLGVNTLTASASGLAAVTFTATATAGTAVSMLPVSQVTQTGTAGQLAASPPSVVVRDALGNPVSGVTVNFNVTQGGGSVAGGTQVTGANGVATVTSWTFGAVAGTNTVVASSGALASVTFTATTAAFFDDSNQVALTGTAVTIPPSVGVTDANGQGAGNVTIRTATQIGGGTLNAGGTLPTVNTVAGVATFNVNISGGAGARTLLLSSPNLSSVTTTSITLP